jgi:aerobic carbon-monoxide dehydrogenase medium subunit
VTLDTNARCEDARLAYCGAGDTPISAHEAAEALVGRRIGATEIEEAASLAQRAIDPAGSVHASKGYQRHLAGVLTKRALHTAIERAHGASPDVH